MEITCQRCHQTVPAESCFCPSCGLPQLVYTAEDGSEAPAESARPQPVRDASSVNWRVAMRYAALFGLPAGIFCNVFSPLSFVGLFWIFASGMWVVSVYARRERPAWITTGAGARIGLVTGLIAAWLAFAVSGGVLATQRFVLNHGPSMDEAWRTSLQQTQEKVTAFMPQLAPDAKAKSDEMIQWQLTPWGRAGYMTMSLLWYSLIVLLFGTAGGAIAARRLARNRRPEI